VDLRKPAYFCSPNVIGKPLDTDRMKKTAHIIICLSLFQTICGQSSEIFGKVKTAKTHEILPGASIILKQDSITVATAVADIDGKYKIHIENSGTYTIVAYFVPDKEIKIIKVLDDANKELDLYISSKCDYPYTSPVKCPDGMHTDHIIPIVYGLPNKKLIRQAKRGKVALGGCMGGCEKYYCKTHKKSF
jgi:hypothetical protein